jgi:hypothetical protein
MSGKVTRKLEEVGEQVEQETGGYKDECKD